MDKKICRKCNNELPINEFYEHKQMADGHLNYCKNCVRERIKKYKENNIEIIREFDRNRPNAKERAKKQREERKNNPISFKRYMECQNKWNAKNKYKKTAHSKLRSAILSGKVIKKNYCTICGKTECSIEGHHYDYSKPLDVIWVCTECHGKLHRKYNKLTIPF